MKKKSKIENFPRSIFQIFSNRLLIDQGQFASRHFEDHQCIGILGVFESIWEGGEGDMFSDPLAVLVLIYTLVVSKKTT